MGGETQKMKNYIHEPSQNSCTQYIVSLLNATHCQDLFYVTVKYHDNKPKGIHVMERTRNCI